MKEPRQFTREEIERLVPEDFSSTGNPIEIDYLHALVQTRLDLEQARKDWDELLKLMISARRFLKGSRLGTGVGGALEKVQDAISRIEQSKKEQEHG